jgi:hypothetical protein
MNDSEVHKESQPQVVTSDKPLPDVPVSAILPLTTPSSIHYNPSTSLEKQIVVSDGSNGSARAIRFFLRIVVTAVILGLIALVVSGLHLKIAP